MLCAVLGRSEVIVGDAGLRERIGVSERELAAAGRLEHAGAVAESVGEGDAHALLIEHDRGGVELHVGRLEPVAGAEEAAGLADVRGQRPAAFALQEADVLGG